MWFNSDVMDKCRRKSHVNYKVLLGATHRGRASRAAMRSESLDTALRASANHSNYPGNVLEKSRSARPRTLCLKPHSVACSRDTGEALHPEREPLATLENTRWWTEA